MIRYATLEIVLHNRKKRFLCTGNSKLKGQETEKTKKKQDNFKKGKELLEYSRRVKAFTDVEGV